MGKAAVAIELSAAERCELESLACAHKTGQAMARRARIVLAAASGLENKVICAEVGANANTVGKWRRRFAEQRLEGLLDEPSKARRPLIRFLEGRRSGDRRGAGDTAEDRR